MPIDPIKIPQNVYIEDRIVGPLTLRQVIIVAIGCGFSYGVYSMLVKTYGSVPIPLTAIVWIPGVLSFAFAFLKINDLTLFRLCLLSVERFGKAPVRTWAPRRGLVINVRTFNNPEDDKALSKAAQILQEKKPEQISELSSLLDRTVAPVPKKETPEALSPMEETLEDEPMDAPNPNILPVNKSRVSASPMNADSGMDIARPAAAATPSSTPSVSIFRDIAPRS